jgi:plasmid segregation protein ParM
VYMIGLPPTLLHSYTGTDPVQHRTVPHAAQLQQDLTVSSSVLYLSNRLGRGTNRYALVCFSLISTHQPHAQVRLWYSTVPYHSTWSIPIAQKGIPLMIPHYCLGFDFGNAETGAVLFDPVHGYLRALTLPSATAPGRLSDLLRTRAGLDMQGFSDAQAPDSLRERGPLSSQEYVLDIDDSEWFVGDLALTQARDASTARGDIHRYWSRRALHLLLVASAHLVPARHPEFDLSVVTGLPVETFTAQTCKQVRAALEGDSTFCLNGVHRTAHIRVLSVIMEGAGALIAHGATRPLTQGCIDVGGRTTDLFVAHGQQPILPLCGGKPLGVETIGDHLSQRVETGYGRPLKAVERRAILRAAVARQRPTLHDEQSGAEPAIYASGVEVPFDELAAWCDTLCADAGAEIAAFVGAAWNSSETGAVGADIAHVVLVGGGAYYVAEALRERIPHLVIAPRPELANATGYAALAQELTRRAQVTLPMSRCG